MNSPLESNPLGILTFIVAPAILTNASSIMALGTSNRFARAIDRARSLLAETKSRKGDADVESALRVRQLITAERRVLLLVRALTAFCGASVLWITVFDMRARGTSGRMRPIRGFDVAVGLALLLPSLYALSLIWRDLGL